MLVPVQDKLFENTGVNGRQTLPGEVLGDIASAVTTKNMTALGSASGLGVALEAAAQLQRTLPDVLFLFVGEGAEKEQLVLNIARFSPHVATRNLA